MTTMTLAHHPPTQVYLLVAMEVAVVVIQEVAVMKNVAMNAGDGSV
jgi:hypothetical protein